MLVEAFLLFLRDELRAVHLGPPGDARTHGEPQGGVRRLILRQQWTRPDKRHITKQHVDELRELIDPCRSQEASGRGWLSITDRRRSIVVKRCAQRSIFV